MSEKKAVCVYCDRGDELVPLVPILYQGKNLYMCSEHLPVLIHKPHLLAEKLDEFNQVSPSEIED